MRRSTLAVAMAYGMTFDIAPRPSYSTPTAAYAPQGERSPENGVKKRRQKFKAQKVARRKNRNRK